jgi:ribose transport system ATP-binding protein
MRNGRIAATLEDDRISEAGILRAAMLESEAA